MIKPNRNNAVIDLIIPARNEEANITTLLETLPWKELRRVVVTDNGSTDQTAQLARDGGATTIYEHHRGYGSACLAALHWIESQGNPPDIVAFIDADLADDPTMLPRLWEPIQRSEADLVIGSRHRLAQPGALTLTQRFGTIFACWLMRLLTKVRYSDLGPMRAVRWSSLQAMEMSDRTWGWTVEMQFKAATQNLQVSEFDVPYRMRQAGTSKISGTIIGSVRAGYKILTTIGKLWWCRLRGHHTCVNPILTK